MTEKPLDATKFRAWAATVTAQLEALEARATPNVSEQVAQIDAELAALYQQYSAVNVDLAGAARLQIEIKSSLKETAEQMGDIEAGVFLDISFDVNEEGKPKYSNTDKQKAAVRIALGKHGSYAVLVIQKRSQEAEMLNARVDVEMYERMSKEFRARNSALVARLNAITAQLS